MNKLLFFVTLIVAISSCNNINNAEGRTVTSDTLTKGADANSDEKIKAVLDPKDFNPLSFIDMAKARDTGGQFFFVMTDKFPENWMSKNYIDTLIKLIDSKQKCRCFLNPISSQSPNQDNNADVGGYALKFLKAYQRNEKISFGLYSCPNTNPKDIQQIKKWFSSARAIHIQ